jgi:vacuolar protein sorting-associated protein 33A
LFRQLPGSPRATPASCRKCTQLKIFVSAGQRVLTKSIATTHAHAFQRRITLMSQRVASLEGAALDLHALREDGRAELVALLTALPGKKCLVLDSALGDLLNHVLPEGSKLLKEKGVAHFRQLAGTDLGPLVDASGAADPPDHIIYLVRPCIAHMKLIAAQIHNRARAGAPFDFRYQVVLLHSLCKFSAAAALALTACTFSYVYTYTHAAQVYFVPQRSLLCEQVLRDEGVLLRIDIRDYPLDLIPLDSDLLSLELEGAGPPLRELSAAAAAASGGCWNADAGGGAGAGIAAVARSLCRLQTMFGAIPHIRVQGPNSRAVLQRAMRVRREVSRCVYVFVFSLVVYSEGDLPYSWL